MGTGALVRLALSPVLAFGAYTLLRPISPVAGMTVGAVLMLGLALLPGTGRRDAAFTQG